MTGAAPGSARAEFTRPEVIDGLRELVSRLSETGQPSRLQIVGGAAIALTLNERRTATADIDGPVTPPAVVLAVAGEMASERNWRSDWLNDAAAQFLPAGYTSCYEGPRREGAAVGRLRIWKCSSLP